MFVLRYADDTMSWVMKRDGWRVGVEGRRILKRQ